MKRAVFVALVLAAQPAAADECRVLDVDYLPAESPNPDPGLRPRLSIVAWLETPAGQFVDTIFITQEVGTYGLGNRPGELDFNSAPAWPYGRRITTFPVWAHRHGLEFPEVVFQDGREDGLSHQTQECSLEKHYFRPMLRDDPQWDAMTRASTFGPFTDKGTLGKGKSLYPPRQDITPAGGDLPSVAEYDQINPFDAVSQASPSSGLMAQYSWPVPGTLAAGDYVLFTEVSREFDQNATYSAERYPAPTVMYGEYGVPYRGQPSVVYRMPFTIGPAATTGTTAQYIGYGDPDGVDGAIRPPDATITVDTPGSGAQRLALVPGTKYRLRVQAHPDLDAKPPGAPGEPAVAVTGTSAVITFLAPGDDGVIGRVQGYELRYLVGDEVTDANFASATELRPDFQLVPGGALQTIKIDHMLPETSYSLGIRAFDNCGNVGPLRVIALETPPRQTGDIDACFIATAAYGSLMANDVEPLRVFRDSVLKHTVLGELAVETYYTFSPSVAGVIGESELLRWTARDVLAPIVTSVRRLY
jgi:hypothetical protein